MPIFPSHVGGSGPRDEKEYEGSADGVRLRQLCEVLLTARAKMLGLSQSFAHRLSSLPPDLKSSLVAGLGEIVAHLEQFEIRLGDTRLTGKARLGADEGMDAHFSRDEVVHVESRGEYRSAAKIEFAESPRQHPALPAPGGARRRRRMTTEEPRERQVEEDLEELGRRRKALVGAARRNAGIVAVDVSRRGEEDGDDGTYGHLYRLAQERRRKGQSRHALSALQHGLLCWVTLGVFTDYPERPEASYEAREEALGALEQMGYVRRVGRKWGPTPAGFEASGLCGTRGLELDP